MSGRWLWCSLVLLAACTDAGDDLQLVGSVERTLIEVSAAVSEVIIEMPVERGVHVEAGQLVARLDPTLGQADVARAEAGVAGMRTRVAVTRHDLERATSLHRRKVASEEQLEHAQLAWEEASARLREAEARLAAAHKRLNDLTLRAPVAGVVDQLPFDLGERVPAGAVIAVLLADGPPWVRVWIPERALARVGSGTTAEVRIDAVPHPLRGRVLDIAREPEFTPHYALTERERVHLVYEARVVIMDAPLTLRPGSPATVIIGLGGAASPGARGEP